MPYFSYCPTYEHLVRRQVGTGMIKSKNNFGIEMTPKKDSSRDLEKHDGRYPRKVGPLPHLSTMHWEISKGIPMIPVPAKPPSLEKRSDELRAYRDATRKGAEINRTPSRRLISFKDAETSNDEPCLSGNHHFNCSFVSDGKQSGQNVSDNRTSNSREHHQRRLELWKGNPNKISMESFQPLNEVKTFHSEEWIEYWDMEVETSYYYNVATGEASWYNPNETRGL